MTELVDVPVKASSIRRAIRIIDILARKGPLGVRALAKEAALPAASVLRILADLAAESVVEQAGGDWDLSFRLIQLGGLQLDRVEIAKLARPFCNRIAERTGETVNVVVRSGDGAVCIEKVRGATGMQLDWPVGLRGPLYCGGSAKAMLAFMPRQDRDRILAAPLPALTEYTITRPAALERELERIRARGYAIDNQEVVIGIWCCAVPILDRDGHAVAAISITGPTPKAAGKDVLALRDMLNEPCSAISRRIGYGGPWIS